KSKVAADVPTTLPGGSTNMVEGIYRGWDELRSVARGSQSGLRVLVLFTDGASNGVPGNYDISPGVAKSLRTADFPKNYPDPDRQTWDAPFIGGLADSESGAMSPSYNITPANWNATTTITDIPYLPLNSWHTHKRSAGIPTSFPLQTSSLKV